MKAVTRITRFTAAGKYARSTVLGLGLGAFSVMVAGSSAHAQMLTGSYVGNGVDDRNITGLGFTPSLVIVKGNAAQYGYLRTNTMADGLSKQMFNVPEVGLPADRIQRFLAYGFQVGTSAEVNANGTTYYWAAFKAVANQMETGVYTGNGLANQSITFATSWQSELVMVHGEKFGTAPGVGLNSMLRTATLGAGDVSTNLQQGIHALTGRITAFAANGFQVGNNFTVNGSGETYHWTAWNSSATVMKESTYVGDGINARTISGLGMTPEFIIVKGDGVTAQGVHRMASMGATDITLPNNNGAASAGKIQALGSGSFQVGTDASVNAAGLAYVYMAFARQNATAVLVSETSTARVPGGREVSWRTSFEADHLGYHVWRERGGARIRVSDGMIPGATLLEGLTASATAGRNYAWVDSHPAFELATRYWIEAVDLAGKSTWHGPIDVHDASRSAAAGSGPKVPGQSAAASVAWPEPSRTRIFPAPSATAVPAASSDPPVVSRSHQALDLPAPSLRISLSEEGWYQVTAAALTAAGLDPSTDPRSLRLASEGQEQALLVTGGEDGTLDVGDSIAFFGLPTTSLFTTERVYFLGARLADASPSASPERIRVTPAVTPTAPAGSGFLAVAERADRKIYVAALRNGDESNFFGPGVTAGTAVEQSLDTLNVDRGATGPVTLQVTLQGITFAPHNIAVAFNGVALGSIEFSDRERKTAELSVALAQLKDGPNLVQLSAGGGDRDVSVVDAIRIIYPHTFSAVNDYAKLTSPAGAPFTVAGFSEGSVIVVDVSDPSSPAILTARTTGTADSGFSVTAVAPEGSGPRTLVAFTAKMIQQPKQVKASVAAGALPTAADANLIIIAHHTLLAPVEKLRAARAAEGWAVQVVDVEAIYDRHAFGDPDPLAIRHFLQEIHDQGKARPRYVLLVGDASLDPRNHLGFGTWNLVPTKLVDTSVMETASDDWLVDFNDDGVPEMAIGRFPARTEADVRAMIDKTLGYQSAERVALISGRDEGHPFAELAEAVGQTATTAGFDVRHLSAAAAAGNLASVLGEPGIVNFLGHGSVEEWTGILRAKDVPALPRSSTPPIVVSMSCLNGFFHDVYTQSLGEALMKDPGGGAVAVWASSSLSFPRDQGPANHQLYRSLRDQRALGDAVIAAKAAATSVDVRRSWILLGDPTLHGWAPSATGIPESAPGPDSGQGQDGSGPSTTGSAGGCSCNLSGGSAPPRLILLAALVAAGGWLLSRRARSRR